MLSKGVAQYAWRIQGKLQGWRLVVAVALPLFWILALCRPDSLGQSLGVFPSYREPNVVQHVPVVEVDESITQPDSGNQQHLPQNSPFSIKPVAYVFPQFHAIPENDKNWGKNFTEWTFVKKVNKNAWGIDILKPIPEIGYYNLLEYKTRARYAQFLKDIGFYGIVYHHYWFERPVMDGALLKMLEDGEPNMPFMFNWANEPWTAHWDGRSDSDAILLAQEYGDMAEWRVHFEWMLPFFRHPNYIRVNGKVQFMIYDNAHIGDLGKRMWDAWRLWAVEEGLGGLDVIETRIAPDNPMDRGPADAINEFGFRSGGGHDGTSWPSINRLGRVYHRGASVSWDNTPRHATDGGATANIFAHPKLWKHQIVELMRRIKLDPNPKGEENFLFVNALNEWGEGNVLEPSVQWGYGSGEAFKEAVAEAASLPWRDDLITTGTRLGRELGIQASNTDMVPISGTQSKEPIDVCVVVRVLKTDWRFSAPFGLSELLDSLRVQTNPRWRAVVVPATEDVSVRIVKAHVLDAFDPRVSVLEAPSDVLETKEKEDDDGKRTPASGIGGWAAMDWALSDIRDSGACDGARYLLVTTGDAKYAPTAFEAVRPHKGDDDAPASNHPSAHATPPADIIGLTFESAATVALTEPPETAPWSHRCERFAPGSETLARLCIPASPTTPRDALDMGALFLNMNRLRRGRFRFENRGVGLMADLLRANWNWTQAESAPGKEACQLFLGGTYSACVATGRFWLDAPVAEDASHEAECYSFNTITGRYGWDSRQWDMAGWRRKPTCLRLSQRWYELDVYGNSTIEEEAGHEGPWLADEEEAANETPAAEESNDGASTVEDDNDVTER